MILKNLDLYSMVDKIIEENKEYTTQPLVSKISSIGKIIVLKIASKQ